MDNSKLIINPETLEYCQNYYEQYENYNAFRIAEKENPESEKEYTKLIEKGKGNSEDFIPIPKSLTNNKNLYFGFNFYHNP